MAIALRVVFVKITKMLLVCNNLRDYIENTPSLEISFSLNF